MNNMFEIGDLVRPIKYGDRQDAQQNTLLEITGFLLAFNGTEVYADCHCHYSPVDLWSKYPKLSFDVAVLEKL